MARTSGRAWSVTAPWLKGCLAGWALQAGLCWREVLESSGLQILSKQLAAKDENNHSAQNNVLATVKFQSFKTTLKWFPGVGLAEWTGLSSCKRKGCEGEIWQYSWLIMIAMMVIFSGLLNAASKHSQREKTRKKSRYFLGIRKKTFPPLKKNR